MLRPVEASSITERAAARIRDAIVSGTLAPGERLIETSLAEQLNLSRGPVREALRQLEREGLIVLRPNRGAVVAFITAEDVLEVYSIRASLGSLALRELIGGQRVTDALLAKLARLASAARRAQSQEELVAADLDFQSTLAEASGLRRVAARFAELTTEVQMFVNVLNVRYSDVDLIFAEHDQLLDAIRRRDLDSAEQVWRARFRRAVSEFVELTGGDERLKDHHPLLVSLGDEHAPAEPVSPSAQPG